jgi:S-DNA-T family DNA segregation ATPase FtsK/SpoIIIE
VSNLSSRKFLVPGLIPVVLALFVAMSLVLAIFAGFKPGDAAWPLVALGDMLFKSFHAASFYLAVYLAAVGLLVILGQTRVIRVVLLSLGMVPATLAGLTLRLMLTEDYAASPLPAWMVANLTHHGAVVVAASSTLISLVVLLQLPAYLRDYLPGLAGASAAKAPSSRPAAPAKPAAAARPAARAEAVVSPESGDDERADAPAVAGTDASGDAVPSSGDAITEFRSAMNGMLESRLKPGAAKPVDLDAPLDKKELKDIWSDEAELARRQAATETGRYTPRRPMFYQAGEADAAESAEVPGDAALAVYFSKDGEISDYPPRGRLSWSTVVEDEALEGGAPAEPARPAGAAASAGAGTIVTQREFATQAVVNPATGHASTLARPVGPERVIKPAMADQSDSDAADDFDLETDDADDDMIAMTDMPGELETFEPATAQSAAAAALARASSPLVAPEPEEDEDELSVVNIPMADTGRPVQDWRTVAAEPVDPAELPETIDTTVLPPLESQSARVQIPTGPNGYLVPIKGLLEEPKNHQYWVIDDVTTRAASILKQTLEEFGIAADVTGIRKGPVITMFEILPAPGVKLAKIVNLADNIALRLAAQSVRIVAPIPGKHAVGIEIPNRERAVVAFAELLMAEGFSSPKVELPVALGKDITGDAQIIDLARTPHLLIAGSTGSGKSVCVNALICSLLYRRSPAEVNMILIDPKIVELKFYNDIPHLLVPVITEAKKAFQALQWCLFEMERRYSLLDAMQVRDIKSYNKKIKSRHVATPHLPYLVVVIDEFADLMATSGKELEGTLARLAAMSRAVGIHLVLATQRPSTDVITGLIKANIPSRIAFMVASKIDSRIILDGMGAEKLLGKGDMLFTSAWDPFPFRMQGAFLSEEEVERVVAHVKTLGKPDYIDDEIFFDAEEDSGDDDGEILDGADDPLLKEAIDIVVSAKKASASYIQRRLKIGYNRAARMVEQMEEMGIVGPQNGSKPREILRLFP